MKDLRLRKKTVVSSSFPVILSPLPILAFYVRAATGDG